jgi:protein SCO1
MKNLTYALSFLFSLLVITACNSQKPPEFRGVVYQTPALPPNFTLPSTQGGEFTLNEQTGKVILLFFGYTYCPDVCPATLGTIKTALSQLTPEERQNVEVVFVTIDPERDTVEQLGRYLDAFNAGFIGTVPTLEELQTLKGGYALVVEKDEIQPDGSYLMAHTGLVYVLDKKGNLRLGFFDGTTADSMVHDIQLLLKE